MTQNLHVTTGAPGEPWTVRGDELSLAGVAELQVPGFWLEVDALESDRLATLVADPEVPAGRAALEAWLSADAVDELASLHAATVTISTPSPAGRALGELARLSLLRAVDAGPRDALWDAEMFAAAADALQLDERLETPVHVVLDAAHAASAVAAIEAAIARCDAERGPVGAPVHEAAARLIARIVAAHAEAGTAPQPRFNEEALVLHEEPAPQVDDLPVVPDVGVLRVPLNRTRLPKGMRLNLDASIEVLRDGTHAHVTLRGVRAWPVVAVYLVGRSFESARMRTLDELVVGSPGTAWARFRVHESDFAEGPLHFDVVGRPDALLADATRHSVVFDLVRSELVRLQLVSADRMAEFSGPVADRLRREQRLLAAELVAQHTDMVDGAAMHDAIDRAANGGADLDYLATLIPA